MNEDLVCNVKRQADNAKMKETFLIIWDALGCHIWHTTH